MVLTNEQQNAGVGYLNDGCANCANLVHLTLLRKQRLMKHCVLPSRAWLQNGQRASPVQDIWQFILSPNDS
jgi:hypothetical protein